MLDQMYRPGAYVFGTFRLDPTRRVLSYCNQPVELRPTLFDVLFHLVQHQRQVVSKEGLLDAVWDGRSVEESNVSQTVFWLRAALKEHGGVDASEMIQTVRGRGYRFAEEARWEHGDLIADGARDSGGVERVAERAFAHPTSWTTRLRQSFHADAWRWRCSLLALLVLALGAYSLTRPKVVIAGKNRIVLADFANDTREPGFDRSLATVLRADLAQSPFVDLVPDKTVRDAIALMTKPAGTVLTPALAQDVCARTNSDVVLGGAITAFGTGYLVTLAATDCSGRREIAVEKAEAAGREAVISALDGMITKVRSRLGEPIASVDRFNVPLIPVKTGSLDALRAYSEGVWLNDHGQPEAAVAPIQHAVSLDPQFASAFLKLAVIYNNLSQAGLAQETLREGYALRASLNPRQRVQAEAYYDQLVTGDLTAELRALSLGTALYPRDASFWTDLANVEATLGRYEKSAQAAQQAVATNPQLETAYLALARADLALGRPDEARAIATRAINAGIGGAMIHAARLDASLMSKDEGGMDRERGWAEHHEQDPTFLQVEGEIEFRRGRIRDGTKIFERISALAKQQGQPDTSIPHRARLLDDLDLIDQSRVLVAHATGAEDDDDYIFTVASLGKVELANKLLARQLRLYPNGTLIRFGFEPEVEAELAMRRGRPDKAIKALEPALIYQARNFDTSYLLGRAYLGLGDARRAETAFRTILTHEGWYPESIIYPLAQLGLARALRLSGDRRRSEAAYKRFIEAWRNADIDAPALIAAKLELSSLKNAPS